MAVIVKDFPGCEQNLGVLVKVIGPVQFVTASEHPMWPVVALSGARLFAINNDGSGPPEAIDTSECGHVLHPDQWLVPLKDHKANGEVSVEAEVIGIGRRHARYRDKCLEMTQP